MRSTHFSRSIQMFAASRQAHMTKIFDPPSDEFGALETRMSSICKLINRLYERGFYKELKLYIHDCSQHTIDEVGSLYGLEILSIASFETDFNHLALTRVKELSILKGRNNMDLEYLAEKCVRLGRLYLGAQTIDHILPFVRRSPNLNKIKAFTEIKESFSIDIVALNREREKLPAAQKLDIYGPDGIFLTTKWATKNSDLNLNLVALRRADSCKFFTDLNKQSV